MIPRYANRPGCILVSHMYKRWHLAGFTKFKRAVEVGTHRGEFARQLLDARMETRENEDDVFTLYGIDPWENLPGYEYQAKFLTGGGEDRAADYQLAGRACGPYMRMQRCQLLKTTSEIAAANFPDGSLCLGYLDGDHSYEGMSLDLRLWWPKIRPGGVLAGHDFICPSADGSWGRYIQPAVIEFAKAQGLDIYVIAEPDGEPWSFYVVKPT